MKIKKLLPDNWNPKSAADQVMAGLRNVCSPVVKGAHDSDFIIHNGKAYVVYMANDVRPGEAPDWPFVYNAMSVVDLASGKVEPPITFAASEKVYENATLPVGACFVPRIIRKDDHTLRCFFTSENPGQRQSQTWRIDFNLETGAFDNHIHQVELETDQGMFPMQPQHLYQHAVAKGFKGAPVPCGLYMIDSFKHFDNRAYAVLNNFTGGHIAWALLNEDMDRFTVLGDFFLPHEAKLSESAVNRLPDGTWLAISRQENRDNNYMFTQSRDGIEWSPHEYRDCVVNGTNSKPVFERFGDEYYLGWQEATSGACRSVFNLEVSRNGLHWERKYRFETDKSFQYPVFREYQGTIYFTVTQGEPSDGHSCKQRIMFGKLENKERSI